LKLHLGAKLKSLRDDALARSSGFILATYAVTATLGFVYWVIAARSYAAATVGIAAVSISAMSLASLLSIVGTTTAPVQRIPGRAYGQEWNLTVTVALLTTMGLGFVAGLVCWALLLALLHDPAIRSSAYGLAIAAGVSLTNGAMVLDSIWIVERSGQTRLFMNSLMSAVKMPLLLLPAARAGGALGIQWGWSISIFVGLGVGLYLLRRHCRYRPQVAGFRAEFRAMRFNMAGNYITSVGANVPTYLIPVMVGALESASSMAYFYSAWRIGSLFFVVANAVAGALFAEGARAADSAIRRAQRAMLFIIPGLLAASLLLLLTGPAILSAFGTHYRQHALTLLLLLVLAAVPDALTTVYRTGLRIRQRYRRAAQFVWGMSLLQLLLTVALLPVAGITGAGVAWLAAECAGVAVYLYDALTAHRRPAGPQAGGLELPPSSQLDIDDITSADEALR